MTTGEQRLLCVVFAAAAILERDETVDSDAPDMKSAPGETTATLTGAASVAEPTIASRGGSNVLRAAADTEICNHCNACD